TAQRASRCTADWCGLGEIQVREDVVDLADATCNFQTQTEIEREVRRRLEVVLRKAKHVVKPVSTNSRTKPLVVASGDTGSEIIPTIENPYAAHIRIENAVSLYAVEVTAKFPVVTTGCPGERIGVLERVLNPALRNDVGFPKQRESSDVDSRSWLRELWRKARSRTSESKPCFIHDPAAEDMGPTQAEIVRSVDRIRTKPGQTCSDECKTLARLLAVLE